jgi:hypothetical protein
MLVILTGFQYLYLNRIKGTQIFSEIPCFLKWTRRQIIITSSIAKITLGITAARKLAKQSLAWKNKRHGLTYYNCEYVTSCKCVRAFKNLVFLLFLFFSSYPKTYLFSTGFLGCFFYYPYVNRIKVKQMFSGIQWRFALWRWIKTINQKQIMVCRTSE